MSNLLSTLSTEDCLKRAWQSLEKRPYSHGFDDITIAQFKENLTNHLAETATMLQAGTYKFYPLRLYLAKKSDGGYRKIKIPTVRDRIVQRAITDMISPYLEKRYQLINASSFAYVKDKNVKKAAERILQLRADGYTHACKADIIKFFDNIDREQLLVKVEAALPDTSLNALIRSALENDIANVEYYEKKTGEIYVPNSLVGIAQGCPLSPLFANVYLADFDKAIEKSGRHMVRYADDFVVMARSLQAAKDSYYYAESLIKDLRLELYPLKDDIPVQLWKKDAKYSLARTCHQLEFLGLRFAGGKVYPAGTAYKNVMKSVRSVAYDPKLGLIKKLTGIDSRMLGWMTAYTFATMENQNISGLDASLEDVLTRMLRRHNLQKTTKRSTAAVLGLRTFQQLRVKTTTKKA